MQRFGTELRLEPISVLVDGALEVLAASPIGASVVVGAVQAAQPPQPTSDTLAVAASRLVQFAERGGYRDRSADLDALASYCAERGLGGLADVLTTAFDAPTKLVRAAWVLGEYQRLDSSNDATSSPQYSTA